VRLERRDGTWTVASLQDAPAAQRGVEDLLRALAALRGEVRGRSGESFGEFLIDDERGIHVEISGRDGAAIQRLVVGKTTSDWSGSFVRRAGDDRVFLTRENLRTLLRLRGTREEPKVEAAAWPELSFVRFPLEELRRVEVELPGSRLVAVREEPPPPAAGAAGEEAAPEGETEAAATPPEAPPAEPRWVLAEPAGAPHDGDKVEALARSLAGLRAQKVAELAEGTDTGLASPERRVTATSAAGQTVTILVGAEVPDGNGARYARIEGIGAVYVLPGYGIENVWKKPADLAPSE
jgi:hypothetical protein